jgi:tellurite resistance protein TerC
MSYWPVIAIIIQLIFLEGILSIDNAAVLGALVTPLPDDRRIPWPGFLQRVGTALDPLLGNQRMAALRVGLLGAYAGRGVMLFVANFLIHNSWIRLVGAAYLIRLAFDELGDSTPGAVSDEDKQDAARATSFWSVVFTVELMDLVFSIDNVVAAVALSSELWVVLVGVGIGILTMRFAAGLFSYAVQREPILKEAAYLLVLNIGFQLVVEEVLKFEIHDMVRFASSILIILACLAYAHIPFLKRLDFLFKWLSLGMGILNDLVDWIFLPVKSLFMLIFRGSSREENSS